MQHLDVRPFVAGLLLGSAVIAAMPVAAQTLVTAAVTERDVSDIRSFKVSVLGEVAKPGRYELKSWATVLDVLAMAGGFTQFALRIRDVERAKT